MKRALFALALLGACSSPSACRAPTLRPTVLPHGFHAVAMRRLVGSGGSETWSDGSRIVQVLEDVQGNLGDGADARKTKVRGYIAIVGTTGLTQAPLAVEWRDRCSVNYAVLTKGLSSSEMLRIANGLRPAR